mmetsp:Transcript_51292/g.76120  ORF Transcript_51292/g.76120 Transcript_51292/m.76120 type:complete len:533 (+) Transcript_51292:137-1735(+)
MFSWLPRICRSLKGVQEEGTSHENENNRGIRNVKPLRETVYGDALKNSKNEEDANKIADLVMEAQENNRRSIYFDAQQSMSDIMGIYTPAERPNFHARATLKLDDPDTLLSKSIIPKQGRRSTEVIKGALEEAEVESGLRGYPGDLTDSEVAACLEFRKQLKTRDNPAYQEMVASFQSVEEEPYALCRFLRARQFKVDEVFEMMDVGADVWKDGKDHDFYPDADEAIGAPLTILLTQYPLVYHGSAKNGCPVSYFRAGEVVVEGVECITPIDGLTNLAWHYQMHKFPAVVAEAQSTNPDVVRCEAIAIFDLKGLTKSQMNARTLEVLKKVIRVNVCFPEVLNRMAILNAPGFFTFFWRVIKTFLDARTASKIAMFSDENQGKEWLREYIEKHEIPSDYGGSGPSVKNIMEETSATSAAKRQISHLLHSNYKKKDTLDFELRADEQLDDMQLQVYTVAVEGAVISISKNGTTISDLDISLHKNEKLASADVPMPYHMNISSEALKGPGKFEVTVKSKESSREMKHFLVIGRIN